MALFDKINDFAKTATEKTASFAKSATEKTENAIEIGKLNSKIGAEDRNISAITLKIGQYYLAKLDSGEVLDSDIMGMFESIKTCRSNIESFRREIEAINAKGVSASGCCEQTPSGEEDTGAKFCPACGAKLAENAHFCASCGAPL